jgi:Tol biopolymer transport system component
MPGARAAMRAGANGLLVFARAAPGSVTFGDVVTLRGPSLYTIAPDGSGLQQLIPPGAVSPDATRLAFTRQGRLYVSTRDGSHAQRLTPRRRRRPRANVSEVLPAWSPDGHWVAFVRFAYEVDRVPVSIWRVHPDGSGLQKLVGVERDVLALKWSPDGRKLAFITASLGVGGQLHEIDANGRRPRVVRRGASYTSLDWAPDSRRLVCATVQHDQPAGIAIIDGRYQHQLTSGDDGPAAWSPDGKLIAFAHTSQPARLNGPPGSFQLDTIGANGLGQRTIASFDGWISGSIDWRAS